MFDTAAPLTAYQQATLALQQAAVTAAHLQAGVALLVGLIQAGVVGYGIRYMARLGERREQQHADRHEEVMRTSTDRHEEAMRTQAERHEEAMRTHAERHQEAMRTHAERHQEAMLALRTLIERTAPPRDGAGKAGSAV